MRLVDVAREVGVSAKTVSNVVNGTGVVRAEMRERILAAIDQLGYRPNVAARALRTGTSGLVALGLPDLREPYFAEFASSFFTVAQRRGLNVVVAQTHGERPAERALSEGEGLPALEGVVVSPLGLTPQDVIERRSRLPLVLIGEHSQSLATERVPQVGVDNVAAAAAATRLLIDKGRRRIAVIGAQAEGSTATSRMRLEGYRQALADAGWEYDGALVGWVENFTRAEGSAAAERLVASGAQFDGLFCMSDSLVFGALYTLGTHGVAMPEDVAVVGYDDVEEGRYSVPPFATISPGSETASDLILDLIVAAREPAAEPVGGRHVVPFDVVDRLG